MTVAICKTSTRRQIDRGAASVQSFIYYLGCVLDMSFLQLLFVDLIVVYTRETQCLIYLFLEIFTPEQECFLILRMSSQFQTVLVLSVVLYLYTN